MTTMRREGRNPTLWAFILIALGVIWLLAEAKVLSGANLVVLFRFWPIILIAFGLELLVGRGSRGLSLLIGLGTVALLLVLMLVGPALGLAPTVEVKTAQYSEPLADATAAQVNLDLSTGRTTVQALVDSTALIDADLRYVGDVNFKVDSGADHEKVVTLSSHSDGVQFFDFLGMFRSPSLGDDELRWNIGLSPKVALDLRLNGGVGDSTFDLAGLRLSRLEYNAGVGESTISLPGSGSYAVALKGGVGGLVVNFANGAAVNATINAGVGSITLDVPDDAPVHLEADSGLGKINVPANFTRISGSDEGGLGRGGVWESASYAAAAAGDSARISISFNGGVGELNVR